MRLSVWFMIFYHAWVSQNPLRFLHGETLESRNCVHFLVRRDICTTATQSVLLIKPSLRQVVTTFPPAIDAEVHQKGWAHIWNWNLFVVGVQILVHCGGTSASSLYSGNCKQDSWYRIMMKIVWKSSETLDSPLWSPCSLAKPCCTLSWLSWTLKTGVSVLERVERKDPHIEVAFRLSKILLRNCDTIGMFWPACFMLITTLSCKSYLQPITYTLHHDIYAFVIFLGTIAGYTICDPSTKPWSKTENCICTSLNILAQAKTDHLEFLFSFKVEAGKV